MWLSTRGHDILLAHVKTCICFLALAKNALIHQSEKGSEQTCLLLIEIYGISVHMCLCTICNSEIQCIVILSQGQINESIPYRIITIFSKRSYTHLIREKFLGQYYHISSWKTTNASESATNGISNKAQLVHYPSWASICHCHSAHKEEILKMLIFLLLTLENWFDGSQCLLWLPIFASH